MKLDKTIIIELIKILPEAIKASCSLILALSFPIVIFIFRNEIKEIISRLKKARFFNQEIELSSQIDKLESSVDLGQKDIPLNNLQVNERDSISLQKILNEANQNPKLALISLAIEIEKELRSILFKTGLFNNVASYSPPIKIVEYLAMEGLLPSTTRTSIKDFWTIRNEIIHGKNISVSESDLTRIIDIGLTLLKNIQSIPHDLNIVAHTNIDIFSDEECTQKHEGKGVMLKTTTKKGTLISLRIFPTTRNNYVKGQQVTWEWNLNKVWEETFYIDPSDNQKKVAWSSSGEFIGRPIDMV